MSNWVASLQLLTIGFVEGPCVRHWTDGAVIGSELFGSDRAERKRLVKGFRLASPNPVSLPTANSTLHSEGRDQPCGGEVSMA